MILDERSRDPSIGKQPPADFDMQRGLILRAIVLGGASTGHSGTLETFRCCRGLVPGELLATGRAHLLLSRVDSC